MGSVLSQEAEEASKREDVCLAHTSSPQSTPGPNGRYTLHGAHSLPPQPGGPRAEHLRYFPTTF